MKKEKVFLYLMILALAALIVLILFFLVNKEITGKAAANINQDCENGKYYLFEVDTANWVITNREVLTGCANDNYNADSAYQVVLSGQEEYKTSADNRFFFDGDTGGVEIKEDNVIVTAPYSEKFDKIQIYKENQKIFEQTLSSIIIQQGKNIKLSLLGRFYKQVLIVKESKIVQRVTFDCEDFCENVQASFIAPETGYYTLEIYTDDWKKIDFFSSQSGEREIELNLKAL